MYVRVCVCVCVCEWKEQVNKISPLDSPVFLLPISHAILKNFAVNEDSQFYSYSQITSPSDETQSLSGSLTLFLLIVCTVIIINHWISVTYSQWPLCVHGDIIR